MMRPVAAPGKRHRPAGRGGGLVVGDGGCDDPWQVHVLVTRPDRSPMAGGQPQWARCSHDGCVGIRLVSAAWCLAHAAEQAPDAFDAELKRIGAEGTVDARGVDVSHDRRMVAGAAQDPGRGAALARGASGPLATGRLVPAGLPAARIRSGRGGSRGARAGRTGAAGGAVPGAAQGPRGRQGRAGRRRLLLRRVRDAPPRPRHLQVGAVRAVDVLAAVRLRPASLAGAGRPRRGGAGRGRVGVLGVSRWDADLPAGRSCPRRGAGLRAATRPAPVGAGPAA